MKTKGKWLPLLLCLLLSLTVLPAAALEMSPRELVVDHAAAPVAGETSPTIQAAIDFIAAEQAANNDGTLWRVLVRAGTYDRFDVPLRTKNITIEGESRENVIVRVLQADDDTFWGASHDSGGPLGPV